MKKENTLSKPEKISEELWRQHLVWNSVLDEQLKKNMEKYKLQIQKSGRIIYK